MDSSQLRAVLDGLGAEIGGREPDRIVANTAESNALSEVHFADGRVLIVKEARQYVEDAVRRFRASRIAGRLLRDRTDVLAPDYLDVPEDISEFPLLAYWKVPNPVLQGEWDGVPARSQPRVLHSFGDLIRRMHALRFPGYGSVTEEEMPDFSSWMYADLAERLLPPARMEWDEGARVIERLVEAIHPLSQRVGGEGVLTHSDLHMGNVLCEGTGDDLRCVGVIDLEHVSAHPPESDVARFSIYHGPLLGRPLTAPWHAFERVWEGYGAPLDPLLLAFFRAYHYLNIGFHAAITGNRSHAGTIARTAEEDLLALESPRAAARDLPQEG